MWPDLPTKSLENNLFRDVFSNPPLFHAYASGSIGIALSSLNDGSSKFVKGVRQIQMQHYQLTLSGLVTEMKGPNFRPSSDHIHVIGVLTSYTKRIEDAETSDHGNTIYEPFPMSPMASLQNIYLLRSLGISYSHMHALYDMVRLRGGITTLEPPLSDIMRVQVVSKCGDTWYSDY
jgi:hypothetical protein